MSAVFHQIGEVVKEFREFSLKIMKSFWERLVHIEANDHEV